jgi:hypothetical protein
MSIDQFIDVVVDIAIHKLPYMESLYEQIKDEVNNMQRTRQGLVNHIEARKSRISILDKFHSLLNKSAGENIKKYRNLLIKRIE